jgi:hypothetical protein
LCYGLYISLPQQEYVWGVENRGNILMHMWFILHFNSYTHWTYFTSLIFEILANWFQQIVPNSTKNPSSAGLINEEVILPTERHHIAKFVIGQESPPPPSLSRMRNPPKKNQHGSDSSVNKK